MSTKLRITNGPSKPRATAENYAEAIRDVVITKGFPAVAADSDPADLDRNFYFTNGIDTDADDHIRGRETGAPCPVVIADGAQVKETHVVRFDDTFGGNEWGEDDPYGDGGFNVTHNQSVLILDGASCSCGAWAGQWRYEASISEVIRAVSNA